MIRKVAYRGLIAKHFPELDSVKLLSGLGNQEDIIKHIAMNKMPHNKEYYTKSQSRKAKLYTYRLEKRTYGRYLDIGAASGHLTREIAKMVGAKEVVGLDVEEWAETNSQDRLDLVKTYDGQSIPMEDGYFDLVSLIFTIHHIPNYKNIIKEAIRVTKPNGVILIVDHDARTLSDKDIIEFDHKLFMIEKVDSYKEYKRSLTNYYSKYFSMSQMEKMFGGKFQNVYHYPRDILKRYVGVFVKQNEE